jgi:hypothetical protein
LTYGEPWCWLSWGRLLESVRSGRPAFLQEHGKGFFDYMNQHPEAAEVFNANMTCMTTDEAAAIVAAYDFSRTRVLVDVGGGQGALVAAVLRAQSAVRAVLFDAPALIADAARRLQQLGVAERCGLLEGDFFDSVPSGGDTYVLKDIVHDWDDKRAAAVLRVCREAMSESAKLLVIERVIPPGNEPFAGKLIDINMLVLTGGRERTEQEYRDLLREAGFELVTIVPTEAGVSVIEARPEPSDQ